MLHAVTLNSDALRLSIFRSHEKMEQIRRTDSSRLYNDIFAAMDYAAIQALKAGHTVIYDAQQSKRRDRRNIEKLAAESNALHVLVWIRTSRETAILRGQDRTPASDSHRYDAAKMEYLIDRFDSVTELPEADENLIEISGEVSFEEQYEEFLRQLAKYQ